jgi:hypothetical protein
MMDFESTQEITPLPCDVKHTFHKECITEWLKLKNECPLCKKKVTDDTVNN